jgi:hypothetical protein
MDKFPNEVIDALLQFESKLYRVFVKFGILSETNYGEEFSEDKDVRLLLTAKKKFFQDLIGIFIKDGFTVIHTHKGIRKQVQPALSYLYEGGVYYVLDDNSECWPKLIQLKLL